MTERVLHSKVEFRAPFTLAGFDAPLAAGVYDLMTEQEGVEMTGHTVYRRTATTLRVEIGGRIEHHPVDPVALEAALDRDRDRDRPVDVAALSDDGGASSAHPPTVQGKGIWRSIPKWVRSGGIGSRG